MKCVSLTRAPIRKDRLWKGHGEISGTYWKRTLNRNKQQKNFEFTITIEEVWQQFLKQNKKCALTGEDIYFTRNFMKWQEQTASLDRIDSTLGYVSGNIQWLHKKINHLKTNMDENKLIDMCCKVAFPIDTSNIEEYTDYLNVKHHKAWKGYEEISWQLWRSLISCASRRGIPFYLTIKEVWDKVISQKCRCAITGEKMRFVSTDYSHDHKSQTASLDRIDSSLPYVYDNVQWVLKEINIIKNKFEQIEFVNMCRKIALGPKSKVVVMSDACRVI